MKEQSASDARGGIVYEHVTSRAGVDVATFCACIVFLRQLVVYLYSFDFVVVLN